MNTELVVASVSRAVALSSVLLSSRFSRNQTLFAATLERQRTDQLRLAEHQDLMSQRRDPLLWAAYDFPSRLFNIVDRRFLDVYYARGDDLQRAYALRSTLHVATTAPMPASPASPSAGVVGGIRLPQRTPVWAVSRAMSPRSLSVSG
ncbi:hypothetical protein ACJ6WF_46870 [Streptomyces sp. MMS24-I2-30]|uniref:hypothetical protein n=1 Tax=Streptomyces sp. MMS24-I2-30 TaxID=3351564 RepID=UPI0038968D26